MIVIGGVAAGMSAAAKARRINPQLAITVFERGEWVSYSACGLPYLVGGLVESHNQLLARSPDEFAKQRIDVRLRSLVTAIDAANQTLTVTTAEGATETHTYDALLLATGARPNTPKIEGAALDGVFSLYTMADALRLQAFLATAKPKRAVLVGGGYIGLEMAENLARHGIAITLVQRPPQLFSSVDADIGDRVLAEVERNGVNVALCESVVSACSGSGQRVQSVETNHGSIETDLVLFATGVRPNIELAQAAGVHIGATGAIAVNDHQRTNVPNIYAAGDCAEHFHRIANHPYWVPLGTTANKQGRVAGENSAGGDVRFHGIVGTAITRAFDLSIGRTGLNEAEAARLGFDAVAAAVDFTDIADYYPHAGPLRVKLVAERGTGRLLGGQAVGTGGVDKRIDVLATALHANMQIDELATLDLGYAPPFNSVWDPILVAAGQLAKKV